MRAALGSCVVEAGRFFLAEERPAFSSALLVCNLVPYRRFVKWHHTTYRGAVDFRSATDVLTSAPSLTLARIADAFGKDTHTITRARMEGEHSRRPPVGWPPVVARLAREHATALREYANQLEELAESLETRA